MFKVGDWVILTRHRDPDFYTKTGINSFGRVSFYEDDEYVQVKFSYINRVSYDYEIGGTFRVHKEDIDPISKLHKLIYGIDTEQETSYTDNKENDT